jgi:dienelactone hydrolase
MVIAPPADADVDVQRDLHVQGSDGNPIAVDLYRPRGVSPVPAVVIVVGYPGGISPLAFKDLPFVRDWAVWFATSGVAAITYTNRAPADDLAALMKQIGDLGGSWGIDGRRVGLFAQSGNVPVGLGALLSDRHFELRCAAFMYGFMLDAGGSTAVADAANTFGFANPSAATTIDDLDPAVPILIVRAGRDQFAGLNRSIDDFVTDALARNRPISVVNLPDAPHGFDMADNSQTSRFAVGQVLSFTRDQLTARLSTGRSSAR